MRFFCQHCKSKYTISDDKIRNKRLKIRCKKCHNIIEIIDPYRSVRHSSIPTGGPLLDEPVSLVMPDPDEPSIVAHSLEDQFAASFQKSPTSADQVGTPGLLNNLKQHAASLEKDETDQPIWFVAINNAPVGPTTANAIHKYKRTGRVTDDSLTWKEGMPDWAPLRNCKELIGLLARIDLTESPSPSRVPAPAVKTSEPKLGLFGEGQSPETDPLKGSRIGVIGAPKTPAQDEVEAPVPDENDDTTAFEQQSYEEEEDVAEYETDVTRLQSLTPPRSGGNRVYLLASVGFFVTALVALIVVVSGGGESSAEAQSSVQTVEKIVEKVVYRDRIVEKEVFKERENEAANAKSRKRSNGQVMAARNRKVQKKLPTNDKTKELMARLSMDTPGGRGPIGPKTNRSAGGGDSPATNALTANQLKRVVNQNKGALKTCYERSLKKGEAPDNKDLRVNFKLTVGKSGMVKNLNFGGAGAKLPTLKSCLNRSVKQWVFPASKGESDLEFPFVFTPTK